MFLHALLLSSFARYQITDKIGMVYSGMGPDYRLLVRRARKMAQDYRLMYEEDIPTAQLVQRVATVMQVSRSDLSIVDNLLGGCKCHATFQ